MTKNTKMLKMKKTQTSVFEQNHKKKEMRIIAFCVINFDPIKIQTHSAPQNDRLNFSFVKDIHVDGGNLA